MSWLGLLLVGIGLADLARSVRPGQVLADPVAAAAVVVLGVAAGASAPLDALGLAGVAALVVGWGVSLRRRSARVSLAVLATGVVAGLLLAPVATPVGGPVARWLAAQPWTWLAGLEPDRAVLLLGVLLVQLSTGNQVVRLVLSATGTTPPVVPPGGDDPAATLKGGRLLGPMERLVIVGLGLAGELTAASVVIAAKGLLRWPELSSSRGQHAIHRLTEYFLVGSFVSWSLALVGLALGS